MTYRIKNIAIGLAAVALSSCSFLETEPDFVTPDEYYNTELEMQQALNGIYNRLIDTNGRMYSRALFSYFALSDEFFYLEQFSVNNIRVQVYDAASLDIGRFWEVLYEGVNRANLLIANLENKELDTANKKAYLGEAYFMRGYYYFILTTFFGEVPLKLQPTTDANDAYLAKSPLQDIYDQIVKDMKAAEDLVLDIDVLGSNERISKTGVQAVLARVYLKMAGYPLNDPENPDEDALEYYEEALLLCNEVISSGKHSLNTDYQQIFINHVEEINDLQECIWEVGMYGNKIGSEDLAGSVGVENGILCRDQTIGYSGAPMRATKKLYDAFAAEDLRRDWSIATYRFVTDDEGVTTKQEYTSSQIYNRSPGKWRREYETGTKAQYYTGINFPLMRYSDVLLMKAEAINESLGGPNSEAYTAINQVRRRAYGVDINTPNTLCDLPEGLSREEFRDSVKTERFREFCFEGQRKLDLIRWGEYVDVMHETAADIQATAPSSFKYAANAGLNTTDRNVLFPIPNTELTVNKLMTQNPGY